MNADTLRTQMEFAKGATGMNLDGIGEDEARRRPAPNGHSINWVLGHILATRNAMHALLGLEPALAADDAKLYARGSDEIAAGAGMDLAAILEGLEASRKALYGAMSEVDMTAACPEGTAIWGENPIGVQLAGLVFHESYHSGQVGVLRKALGHDTAIA